MARHSLRRRRSTFHRQRDGLIKEERFRILRFPPRFNPFAPVASILMSGNKTPGRPTTGVGQRRYDEDGFKLTDALVGCFKMALFGVFIGRI